MSKGEVNSIRTRVAHAGWEDHRHFGFAVFGELAGKESYAGLMALAVTGRRLDPQAARMLDDLSAVLTVAEPRIWPPKATRLAAAYGSVIAGFAAGNLCMEGDLIGPWTAKFAAANLVELSREVGDRIGDMEVMREAALKMLEEKRRLIGFGVPFRPRDERLIALESCVKGRGRAGLRFWRLSTALAGVLRKERGLEANIGLGSAAVCLDLGFEPAEISPLVIFINQNVFAANAVEAAGADAPSMRCLPNEKIDYVGRGPRTSDRAGNEH